MLTAGLMIFKDHPLLGLGAVSYTHLLTADVYAGDYIVAEKVADEPAAENKYLYNLNGEKQAISITISSFAEGLSGKLKSGDICLLYTSRCV